MKKKLFMQALVALVVVLGTIVGTGIAMSATQSDNGAGLHITVLPAPASPLISNKLSLSGVVFSGGGGGGGGGGGRDTTPPTIKNVSVSNITETSADISWNTDEMSDSQVEYWSSPSVFSPLDKTKVIDHLVHLAGLTPGSTCYFRVMSKDDAGNLAVSSGYTFTTLGTAPMPSMPAPIPPTPVPSPPIPPTPVTPQPLAPTPSTTPIGPVLGAPTNWPLIGGVIAAVVVVGLSAFFLVRRRASRKK